MFRVAFVIALVAKILMFRDALRRGAPSFWFWIIAFMPLGEVAYFFVYPFDDLRRRRRRAGPFGSRKAGPLDAPTVIEKLSRAQGLYDEGDHAAAARELEAILRHSEHHKEALYLLGMSRMQLDEPAAAIRPFRRLVDIKGGHRDYAAWLMLARAEEESGDLEGAIVTLERLVERSPRLRHLVLLAECAAKAGDPKKARTVLSHAMGRDGDREWIERRDRLDERLSSQPA